ncbi:MAG: Rdx family protein [Anaerolineae bacterium]|nr:Rdx family protein [Anaerolineae bacterium]
MAAGLAAAIEHKFGLQAELIEGRHGIYEIAVNGKLVYSNQAYNHPPLEEEIFAEINQYQPPLAETSGAYNVPMDTDVEPAAALFCVWTPPSTHQAEP